MDIVWWLIFEMVCLLFAMFSSIPGTHDVIPILIGILIGVVVMATVLVFETVLLWSDPIPDKEFGHWRDT